MTKKVPKATSPAGQRLRRQQRRRLPEALKAGHTFIMHSSNHIPHRQEGKQRTLILPLHKVPLKVRSSLEHPLKVTLHSMYMFVDAFWSTFDR